MDAEPPAGGSASIDLDHIGPWVRLSTGGSLPTGTIPDNGDDGEIAFARVTPGTATVSVTPPDGATGCQGPDEVTVQPDTITWAVYLCG